MTRILIGIILGLSVSAWAQTGISVQTGIFTPVTFVLAGGMKPDKTADMLKLDEAGNVLAKCVP